MNSDAISRIKAFENSQCNVTISQHKTFRPNVFKHSRECTPVKLHRRKHCSTSLLRSCRPYPGEIPTRSNMRLKGSCNQTFKSCLLNQTPRYQTRPALATTFFQFTLFPSPVVLLFPPLRSPLPLLFTPLSAKLTDKFASVCCLLPS